ncbi:hypothetical protein BREVNS_0152 [Brevinematales bacterium NS]|nr:hypothetical protein BREVNS_0152 [Brevinematales bacterium NS]
MALLEDFKAMVNGLIDHADEILFLDLKVKMKNGNYIHYRVDHKKEQKLRDKLAKMAEKKAKSEAKK